jgi:hypothetical protein
MNRLNRAGALVCVSLAVAVPASADVVTHWNDQARIVAAANRPGPTNPPGTGPAIMVDIAMVQAAIHDAIQAYDQRFEPYAAAITSGPGSPVVAAARAARDVLVARFPLAEADIQNRYLAYLASEGLTPDGGEAVGSAAAAAIVARREGDGSFPAVRELFFGTAGIAGAWFSPVAMFAPWLGDVVPFTLPSTSMGEPGPIPALTSLEYAEAFNEVKAVGSLNSSARTPAQTRLARFFTDDFFAQFARVLDDAANRHLGSSGLNRLGDRARLFALAHLATADALICAWHAKRELAFWRPEQAIRNADIDGNALTDKEATWTPFVGTPPYPDYTSGANNVAGAMTRVLALFFGTDHLGFNATTTSARAINAGDPTTRTYRRFSDLAEDIVDVRIYQGIHFRFADTEARSQARRVANHAFRNYLRPLD